MARKNTVKTECEVCNKVTVHEVISIDGHERRVCLRCEEVRRAADAATIKYEERHRTDKSDAERNVEIERNKFAPTA
jgi:ribosome-binding protein aMBF1 (putative translation factor)